MIAFRAYEPVSIHSSAVERVDASKIAASGFKSSTDLKMSLRPSKVFVFFAIYLLCRNLTVMQPINHQTTLLLQVSLVVVEELVLDLLQRSDDTVLLV